MATSTHFRVSAHTRATYSPHAEPRFHVQTRYVVLLLGIAVAFTSYLLAERQGAATIAEVKREHRPRLAAFDRRIDEVQRAVHAAEARNLGRLAIIDRSDVELVRDDERLRDAVQREQRARARGVMVLQESADLEQELAALAAGNAAANTEIDALDLRLERASRELSALQSAVERRSADETAALAALEVERERVLLREVRR